jgi:flagellar hook protein FlgE
VHLALDNTTYQDPNDPTGNTTIRASSSGLINFTTTGAVNWGAYGNRNAEHFGTNAAGTAGNDPNIPGGVALPAVAGTWQAIADADVNDGSIIGFEGATVPNSPSAIAAETSVPPFGVGNEQYDQEAVDAFGNPFAFVKLPIVLVYQNVPTGSPIPPSGTTAGTRVQSLDGLGVLQNGIAMPDGTLEDWYVQSFNIDWGSVSTITQADFDRATAGGVVGADDGAVDGRLAADDADGHDFVWDPYVVSQNNGGRDGLTQDTTGEFRDINGVSTYIPRYTAIMQAQDGYKQGILQGVSVSADGKIYGAFDNGITQELAQIAVATFENPAGLAKVGETHFTPTANSGNAIIGTALTGGRGSVIGGVVEQSNVDLSEELTNMIVAQRGFEVNARLITTSDRILDTLVNLGR